MGAGGEIDQVSTDAAPEAIGPYCQATGYGGLLFCSGQLPLDPATGDLVQVGYAAMAHRCLENLEAVCTAAGTSLDRALKVTIYIREIASFVEVNEAYASHFPGAVPARSTVEVSALPASAALEMDAIVAL